MQATVINLHRAWPRLRQFLDRPIVQEALDVGMRVWCRSFRIPVEWEPRNGPWYYSRSDYWLFHKKPQPTEPEWYQVIMGCHWIRAFACALGREAYPQWEWAIIAGKRHSTAVGFGKNSIHVLDINLWKAWRKGCAAEILELADYWRGGLDWVDSVEEDIECFRDTLSKPRPPWCPKCFDLHPPTMKCAA